MRKQKFFCDPLGDSFAMKKAFTLIELLVVIAIIAILAAILFPVFAQAKVAAKKTQFLSQYKQIATSTMIYLADYDDTMFRHGYTLTGQTTLPNRYWPENIQPYVKNWEMFNDAQVNDPLRVWSTPAFRWWYNQQRWPTLGYNVNYMNNAGGDCGQWNVGGSDLSYGPPISHTSINSPSATVLFASTKRVGTSTGAYISNNVESPGGYLANDTCTWSNGGWGVGSFGDTAGWYPGNPTSTGDFAATFSNQGIVIFTDSSAKTMQPGRLAAGTDWRVGIANTAINITDRSQYIWDTQS
jgi:prepilin-type N-terminal cleavage/methylation domain-containing protein